MKRIFLSVMLIVGVFFTMSLMASESSGLSHLAFQVNTTSKTSTEIVFNCPDYNFQQFSQDGKNFSTIKVENAEYLIKEGYPELPFFTTSIAIPFNSSPVVKSQKVLKTESVENLLIAPSQGLDTQSTNFKLNAAAYKSNSVFPEQSIIVSEPQIFRDFYIVTVTYYPFSYNAAEQKLIVNKNARFVIEHSSKSNQDFVLNNSISRAFDPLYRALIDNYEQIRPDYVTFTNPVLLIIHPNSSNTQFQTSLNQLITWKKQTGFVVNTASTAQTGTTTSSIKNYIQAQYDNLATRPDYLMIIGDAGGGDLMIPCYNLSHAGGMPSGDGDDPYSFMNGANDYFADIHVGRVSADNAATFGVMVSKIVNYERYPDAAGTDYLNTALLVGATSSSGISTVQVNQYIKDNIELWDPSHNYTEQYGNPSGDGMKDAINAGVFYFNFRGYIGMSGFGDSQVSALTNVKKLVTCVFLTCGTGNIASTSMIETIARAGTAAQPKGAIASYGLATSHTLTPYNNFISCSIANSFFGQNITTFGGAVTFSQTKLLSTYSGDLIGHSRTLSQWMNLIGDPTINIHRSIPKNFTVIPSSDSVFAGLRSLKVTVLDPDNQPVSGACVTISGNSNEFIQSAYTDENGIVILPVSDGVTTNVVLTVRKADFIVNFKTLPLSTTGVVGFESYVLNDAVNGNNNQQINPGETIRISSVAKNFTTSDLSGISLLMRSDNPNITISDSTATIASLLAGSTINLDNEFAFNVNPLYPANLPVNLTFVITAGAQVYQYFMKLDVKAIDLDLNTITILTESGAIPLGETAQLKIKLDNNGQINSGDVTAVLRSKNLFLQVVDSTAVYPNINPGQNGENTNDLFSVHSLAGILPGVKLSCDLILTNTSGYREVLDVKVQVGTVHSYDPIPPDAYGYIMYDITDSTYDDAPVYNWIDITSTGTVVPLTDTGDDTDDVETVSLPFTFKMYGKDYNQISVCSNGWLGLGVTQQSTFRNVAIPGPMVPRPVIAPYWNDLAKSGTGSNVYKYYNAEEHYFVVCWNNMKVVKTVSQVITTANVSFQVILYDPLYVSTALGDAPILMQYKDFHPGFNNDDLERPNNYFTTGIQDETGLIGQQYVFNNIYSPGAAPLTNNSAILITQPYFLSENPYLSLANPILHDENGNGFVEAGEIVNIGLPIVNVGMNTATNVTCTLSSANPHVEIINGSTSYVNIDPSGSAMNIQYLTIRINSASINDENILVDAVLNSSEGEWQRAFNINVKKPSLAYRSYIINDAEGNGNGILNSGESAKLVINMINQSFLDVNDVQISLDTNNNQYITLGSSSVSIPIMQANGVYQAAYDVQLAENIPDQTLIPIEITANSNNADPVFFTLQLGVNQSGSLMTESFNEWLPQGWIVQFYSSNWNLSETNLAGGTAPEVKFSGSPAFNGTTRLVSPTMDASDISSVTLTFKQKIDVLAPGTIVGVATRSMYSAWHTVWSETLNGSVAAELKNIPISNADLGRQNFQICWYIEGNSGNIDAWYLDDVVVQTAVGNSAIIRGSLSIDNPDFDKTNIRIKAGEYSTICNTEGQYTLYLLPGFYATVQALNPYISANTHTNIVLASGEVAEDRNFTANFASEPTNLIYNMNPTSRIFSLYWSHQLPDGSPLQVTDFRVYRQVNSGVFELVQESMNTSFTEELQLANRYRYYVIANYGTMISDSSVVIYVDPNVQNGNETPQNPLTFSLKQNYPNPFNPTTTVAYSLAEKSQVSVKVYNIKGQLVKTLVNGMQEKGQYHIVWNGQNSVGKKVSSGIYFIRMDTPSHQFTKKALMLK